jgi:hypothetical protein
MHQPKSVSHHGLVVQRDRKRNRVRRPSSSGVLKLQDQSNAASYFVRHLSGTWLVECKTRAREVRSSAMDRQPEAYVPTHSAVCGIITLKGSEGR